jgi:putative peptidoglycan lipid II flippase
MSDYRNLLKSASTISTLTILSRIFGYIRDSRMAFLLGTENIADAFTIAYRIPNLLRRLVGEGAVNAAFIPVFSRYLAADRKDEAWEFANTMLTLALVLLTAITVIGILFSPLLVKLVAYGFTKTPGKLETAAVLNRIVFPYIALVSLSAIAMGILNSFHRFAASAFAPVLFNLSVITFSFFSRLFSNPAMALAVGVVVGGVLQVGIQVPSLIRNGWRLRLMWNLIHPGVRTVGRLLIPLVFGIGIVQINVLVDSQFAAYMAAGSVASIYLADRVMELVLGGYTIALSTAILPVLSRQAAGMRLDEMKETLHLAIRLILFMTVPATVGLVLLRRPIIQVLFEHGSFDAASTELTVRPLLFFAFGLSMISMVKIIVPAFYALHDTRTPVKIAFMSMFINAGLNFLFMRPLQNGGPPLATSLAAVFDSSCLVTIFFRRYGSFGLRDVCRSLVKFVAAGIVMAFVTYAVIHIPGFYAGSVLQRAVALGSTILIATGTYFAVSYALRTRELGEVFGMYGGRPRGEVEDLRVFGR